MHVLTRGRETERGGGARGGASVPGRRSHKKVIVEHRGIHQPRRARRCGEVRRRGDASPARDAANAGEDIVHETRCRTTRQGDELSAGWTVIYDRVVYYVDLVRPAVRGDAFLSVGNDCRVAGVRPLLDQISDDEGQTPIGQVDFVTCVAFLGHDAVVENVVLFRPALDCVTFVCAMRVAVAQREQVSAIDVHIVCATEGRGGALAVVIEF